MRAAIRTNDTRTVSKWSHTPIETRFRTIDGLTIRFAESNDRDAHALLLSPWPESLLAFEQIWVCRASVIPSVATSCFRHGQWASSCFG